MNFLLHGTTLALAWFLVVNLAVSAFVAWIATRPPLTMSPTVWFAVRILPACAAALFVAAVFLPSYWRYEPRDTTEGFDLTLTVCAVTATGLLGAAAIRGLSAWRRAAFRVRVWLHAARPLCLAGSRIPAFEVETERPFMALAGVVRPRLIVTRGLLTALSDEELAACVAHELSHSRAWDNLKRLAMRASPDALFGTPIAREIERRWASAAEHAADDRAGHTGAAARCALASALVKVAKLMPDLPVSTEPISTLLGGGEIASRVQRLLDDRTLAPSRTGRGVWIALGTAAVVIGAEYGPLLHAVHHATELLVQLLP
jgi:Peptidase family M48